MYAQLARFGLPREDTGTDDPVSFFDGYFKLKGSREKGKPLKLYFVHRIRAEHLRLFDFVCGTLFGSRSGRIHDIVTDWISSLKGWKPRIVRGEDGCWRLRWERTEGDGAPVELPIEIDPAAASRRPCDARRAVDIPSDECGNGNAGERRCRRRMRPCLAAAG